MVKVYFETSGHAELVATFMDEELYIQCLPYLMTHALETGFDKVTETIEEDDRED